MESAPPSYRGHRYPVEVIAHCVWLYFRFPLSLREVEELMLQRGVIVSYETIRRWCAKFGQPYANGLRRRQPRPGDKWHLDEVFIKINGERKHLWRAVDQDGNVLDILVQNRRDTAARRFFRHLMKKTRAVPRPCSRIATARWRVALSNYTGLRSRCLEGGEVGVRRIDGLRGYAWRFSCSASAL